VSIAASVLSCFSAHPELGATQVARELGVAKSTACRMLSALAAGGLLDRASSGRYRLSLRMFELGVLAAERIPVRDAARPVLIELQQQVREMVQLGVPVAGHVAYIDRYGHAALGLQLSGETLHRVPGYSSSSGRVLAAFDDRVMADTLAVPQAHPVHHHRPRAPAPGAACRPAGRLGQHQGGVHPRLLLGRGARARRRPSGGGDLGGRTDEPYSRPA
jgi:DNA-binding IclR family transcriptional regulator